MSANAVMDTHKYYQRLKEAGVEDRQAEAMTEGLATIAFGSLATKDDLKSELGLLRSDLRAEMDQLRSELKGEMGELRSDLKDEMGEHRSEVKGEIAEMRMAMHGGFQRLFVRVTGVMGAFVGIMALFVALVGFVAHTR